MLTPSVFDARCPSAPGRERADGPTMRSGDQRRRPSPGRVTNLAAGEDAGNAARRASGSGGWLLGRPVSGGAW